MDDPLASMFFGGQDDEVIHEVEEEHEDEVQNEPDADPVKKARSLRRGLIKAAGIQDMLLEKYPSPT